MSTRAVIKIEGIDYVQVYKHCDGYPKTTLEWLEDFNSDFTKNRGDDPEYKLAQLLRSSARDGDKYDLDQSKYTGWGLQPYNSDVWQEYEYLLKTDGSVEVKEV